MYLNMCMNMYGYGTLRSKTKINYNNCDYDVWSFDGSSSGQAEGHSSDILLKPVRKYNVPFRKNNNSYLVLCETFNNDGTPHVSNNRHNKMNNILPYVENYDVWVGVEQEYVIYYDDEPLHHNKVKKR